MQSPPPKPHLLTSQNHKQTMNKAIFTLLVALMSCPALAQTPKYSFSTWTSGAASYQKFDQHDVTIQNINTPADLPGLPQALLRLFIFASIIMEYKTVYSTTI
jgi:hypothetical protein